MRPWAAEAGEQVHYLDRMHFYRSSQRGSANLNAKVLTTGLCFRYSHSLANQYQTSLDIPQEIRATQTNLNQRSEVVTDPKLI